MEQLLNELEWTPILTTALVVFGAGLTSRWAWNKLPKKDVGTAALATVQAAEKAIELHERVVDDKLEELEKRVAQLEKIVIEKDEQIKLKEEEILKYLEEIKLLRSWCAALMEQLAQAGHTPVSYDEWRRDNGNQRDTG